MVTQPPLSFNFAQDDRFKRPPWNQQHPDYQRIDAKLPPNHLARQVANSIQYLDLAPLAETYSGRGSQAVRPDLLLVMILYLMQTGISKPASWFRVSRENEVIQWLEFGIQPARSTFYEFKDRYGKFLRVWNRDVLTQAAQLGITNAQRGALDGTHVAAQGSRHLLVRESTIDRRLSELEAVRAEDEKEATSSAPDAEPMAESSHQNREEDQGVTSPSTAEAPSCESAPRAAWMANTPRTRQQQEERYRETKRAMDQLQKANAKLPKSRRKSRDQIKIPLTEPQAAFGRDKLKTYRGLYTPQVIKDLDSPLILGCEVFAQATDSGTLPIMLDQVHDTFGQDLSDLLVDAGYVSLWNLQVCETRGTTLYGPIGENDYTAAKREEKAPTRQVPKSEFTWDANRELYLCPEGHEMPAESRRRETRAEGEPMWSTVYRCDPQHCSQCPLANCAKNPSTGRTVSRLEREEFLEEHRARMESDEAKELLKLRGQHAEGVFADLKAHRGCRQISGRGLTRAQTQLGSLVLIHNLLVIEKSVSGQTTTSRIAGRRDSICADHTESEPANEALAA